MTASFIQINFLTSYGANVLNRDDLNRPKSMVFGSAPRLRLSSQAVKRAWRLSEALATLERGTRTRGFWLQLGQKAVAAGHAEVDVIAHILPLRAAVEGAKAASAKAEDDLSPDDEVPATEKAGKKKAVKKQALKSLADLLGNLFFFSKSEELALRDALTASLGAVGSEQAPMKEKEAEGVLTSKLPMSADVAMFGRMVAENRRLSVEGAVQVAHVFTVHKSVIDDDYFSAVDDLAGEVEEITGSAHIDANAFGSGMYYGFVNVDVKTLLKNLNGDIDTAKRLIEALVEACATVAPTAKQNTFAARSYASYVSIETGNAQPRSYADAFIRPVTGEDTAGVAIQRVLDARAELNRSFPGQAFECTELNRVAGTGSLPELQAAAVKALG